VIKENKGDEARFQAKWRRPNYSMQLTRSRAADAEH